MRYIIFSAIASITFGLSVYLSYLAVVTGLNPITSMVLGIFLIGLLSLNVLMIKKSNNKTLARVGFLLFGLLLPYGLIVNKKWDVDKSQVREYQEPRE